MYICIYAYIYMYLLLFNVVVFEKVSFHQKSVVFSLFFSLSLTIRNKLKNILSCGFHCLHCFPLSSSLLPALQIVIYSNGSFSRFCVHFFHLFSFKSLNLKAYNGLHTSSTRFSFSFFKWQ